MAPGPLFDSVSQNIDFSPRTVSVSLRKACRFDPRSFDILPVLSLPPSDPGSNSKPGIRTPVVTFRREQGLLHNYVTSIVEAQDGSIWFGAAYGVSRYDVVNWTHYTEGIGLA